VREPSTADAACIVRIWIEPGDAILRGRVTTLPAGTSVAARGVAELVGAVQSALEWLEELLARQELP
jgi:hypothetical protein